MPFLNAVGVFCFVLRQLSLKRSVNMFLELHQHIIFIFWKSDITNEGLKMKKWSSKWTQFMQLRKEAWKKFRTSTGFEPVTSRDRRCDALPTEPLTLGAGQLWIHLFPSPHFFHGNIWTHNWPAPNVIAQLIEHRTGIPRSQVQTPLKSWIFFRLLYAIA